MGFVSEEVASSTAGLGERWGGLHHNQPVCTQLRGLAVGMHEAGFDFSPESR